ncbi:DUF1289 domain-containing protein [Vibrio japonicus]|uniref:DUF1289 domain-containing protein n=1 Tax=Vibrio japonicus TaxID=1824638 RepID=A0ABY5LDP5_9VIBR|nr:DUF1289 domain-containing protein [Vibrio japonicus]UUM29591.1 DUF1289 domain-containing protein [Vibrio japonicus]
MEQLEFFEVPSPCVGVCTVDEKGYCKGCMRNRDERFNWLKMSNTHKLHVIKLCRQRYLRKLRAGRIDVSDTSEDENPQQDLF